MHLNWSILSHCWFNVGRTSWTAGQHWTNNGSLYRACWVSECISGDDRPIFFICLTFPVGFEVFILKESNMRIHNHKGAIKNSTQKLKMKKKKITKLQRQNTSHLEEKNRLRHEISWLSNRLNQRNKSDDENVLSSKLFNEFLQDLRKYLNPKYGHKIGDLYLAYLLFADDIVLFSEFAANLQAQIELFYKYCEIWNLIISIAKTKIVIYNQIYAKYFFSFILGENALEIVDKYKYLGLWCSNNKNIFVKKHSYLAEQARKAIFTIRNYSHSLGHLTPKLSLRVFEAQIEPILMYGSEVLFIGKEISDFEMVHLSCLKNMPGVKQQATSVTIYRDTGRYPLFLKQQILALKYWIRLISLPKNCYLRIVYNSLASLDFIGETNLCFHISMIRSLLFRANHCDVWKNHRVENTNRLIKQVKLCLINIYKADWSNKAQNSIKLRTYIKFKFDHSLEEYLFYIPDTRWIKLLSILRMRSHMLEIERGRHVKPQKIPLEQRTCQRCTLNSVDDEIHFFNYLLLLRYAAN